MLINEVILENFMSYEYARVPLKQGVNLIVGPNGAGKSSLLLAISVALGQTYTERSKKLSNLIRWGKDQARVTVVLNNEKQGSKRPAPKYNKDQIFLTRGLRRDGQYWFELENRAANRQDIQRLLNRFGVDPDNMLIIMHQNMVEQFSVLNNTEKLHMVEAAVGLEPFRENVTQAQQKLTRTLSQAESVTKLLESAQQTLNYWREQYEKYQEKKQLQTKRCFLERELNWAEVEKRENISRELQTDKQNILETIKQITKEATDTNDQWQKQQKLLLELKNKNTDSFNKRIIIEQELAKNEATISLMKLLLKEISLLQKDGESPNQLTLFTTKTTQTATNRLINLKEKVKENQTTTEQIEEQAQTTINQIVDHRIKLALLEYQKEKAENDLNKTENAIKTAKINVETTTVKAEQSGQRIVATKPPAEIQDEIRLTDGHLAALANVSEDIEHQYESYSKLFLELKEKAQMVAENRQKTLEEVAARMQSWRNVIRNLLDRVNIEYQKIMAQTRATGEVKIANTQDIEAAGLEILVGFKGGKPVPLDAHTQSGGERTTATMSFLLALQQHVRSPFRAVDEYDIHMDPRNREMIAKILIATIKDTNAQYIIITPSQVTFAQENANIVTVQNIEGKSAVKEIR